MDASTNISGAGPGVGAHLSPASKYSARLNCLKSAKEAGAITSPEHAEWKAIATAEMMGMPAAIPNKAGPSNASSGRRHEKRARRQLSDVENSSSSDPEYNSEDDEASKRGHRSVSKSESKSFLSSKGARAARKSQATEMFASSATCVTCIYVLLPNGKAEPRKIPNSFVDKVGEQRAVWAPMEQGSSIWWCSLCRKTGQEGGRIDVNEKGFGSQKFKSKMNHNSYRMHTNKLVKLLPEKLEDDAQPVYWPETCKDSKAYADYCKKTAQKDPQGEKFLLEG